MDQTNMLLFALEYLERCFSVIPVAPDKTPLMTSWKARQIALPTSDQIKNDWQLNPNANVAIITGGISGIVVLDIDGEEGLKAISGRYLPVTPCVKTGKGFHYYFQHPGHLVKNFTRKLPGLDFRGDGGYVVAPPSKHLNGNQYEWVDCLNLKDVPLAKMPQWLLDLVSDKTVASSPNWVSALLNGVNEGTRNDSCARLAGHYLSFGLNLEEIKPILLTWNGKNNPPLSEGEVMNTLSSIAHLEAIKSGARVEWEPPVPFDEHKLPPFPTDVFPQWLKDFVEAESLSTQTPTDLAGMLCMAVCALTLSKKFEVLVRPG